MGNDDEYISSTESSGAQHSSEPGRYIQNPSNEAPDTAHLFSSTYSSESLMSIDLNQNQITQQKLHVIPAFVAAFNALLVASVSLYFDIPIRYWCSLLAIALFLSSTVEPLILRMPTVAQCLFLSGGFVLLTPFVLTDGGFQSNTIQWLWVIPLSAAAYTSRRLLLPTVILTVLVYAVVSFLDLNSHLENLTPVEYQGAWSYLSVLLLGVYLIFSVKSFSDSMFRINSVNERLIQRLNNALETQRESQRELESLAHELTKASRAKSDFLANKSHEIRTPLNGIFGSLQVVRGHPEDQETVVRYTNVAMQSYHSVLGIVNDILDISKITEGKVSLFPEPARLGDTIGMVASELAAQAHNKGIKLKTHCSVRASEGNRLIDTTRLSQILRNILSNAIKFTDKGTVSLSVDIGNQNSEVIIVIEDTGVGIPADKLETVFEAFEQAEASRTTERAGTGLGLAITKRLVELMNGSISVDSTLGEGTRFTVKLTLPATQQPTADQEQGETITEIKPARILLVEDVTTNRLIFKALLKTYPFEIIEAVNGEIGVEKALNEEFDLVFMDIQMPVMDGLGALSALKAANYDKPVIACTANVMKEDIEQYLAAGFDSVIGKPYLQEDLISNIQAAVTRGSLPKYIKRT